MKSLSFCIFTVLVLGLSACSKKEDSTPAGKTLVYCSEGSPTNFNPQYITDGTSHTSVIKPVYNQLIEFKYGETTLVPGLASSWDISQDNLTYTFKLRAGVKFHSTEYFTSTRDFNADDVVFSIERQRDVNHPFHKVGGGAYEYFQGMDMGKLIKDVKKLDPMTVQITLNYPNAPFLANLAMGFMSVLSAEYADQLTKDSKQDQIDQLPIGTGPFKFVKYEKDGMIKYVANTLFWGGAPKLAGLVFSITPDASVRFQKLKTGECHFVTFPAPQDLEAMRKMDSLKIMEDAGLNVGYLAMNVQKAPLDKLVIRQAIAHALNRESYLNAIYLNQAMLAVSPIPPTMWGYNHDITDPAYDPELAKKLIKESGVPTPIKLNLWALPVSRPYNPNGKKLAEMMQADLAKVGFEIEILSFDWGTYLAKAKEGTHNLIQLGWTGDNGDPDNFLATLLDCPAIAAGANVARWCNKDFDDLVLKAQKTSNQDERAELYKKSQAIFKAELPWVTLAHAKVFKAMVKNLEGYKIDPLGTDLFTYAELK